MNDKRLQLRVPDDELKEWKRKAEKEGMPVSEWVRQRCNGDSGVAGVSDVAASAGKREDATESPAEIKKPKARKSENAELVAGRTGHEVGCECFDCVQVGRFFKDMRKEA